MADVQTGLAVVWGAGNFEASGTGIVIGINQAKTQNWDGERSSDVADLKDGDGETVARAFYAFKKRISISVIPYDDNDNPGPAINKTEAEVSMNAFLIAPGTAVTIADTDDIDGGSGATVWESSNSGKYYLERASVRRTNTGMAVIDMDLVQYEDSDITTATT